MKRRYKESEEWVATKRERSEGKGDKNGTECNFITYMPPDILCILRVCVSLLLTRCNYAVGLKRVYTYGCRLSVRNGSTLANW